MTRRLFPVRVSLIALGLVSTVALAQQAVPVPGPAPKPPANAAPLMPTEASLVVSAKDLPAGHTLTPEDLMRRNVTPDLAVRSYVTIEEARTVLGQRLLEPLTKGEPIRWTQLTLGYGLWAIDDYCARNQGDPLKKLAYPIGRDLGGEVKALVATRPLREGTKLDETALELRTVPADLAGFYAVQAEEKQQILGQTLLVTMLKGEPLRFTQLAGYAKEPRCKWLQEEGGNVLAKKAPADAKAVRCPEGTQRLEGLPGGAAWRPFLPGYAVMCKKGDQRHGPFAAWSRTTGKKVIVGEYKDGQRHGRWARLDDAGKVAGEHFFTRGAATGTWVDRDEKGRIVHREEFKGTLRHGAYIFEAIAGQFADGKPVGTFKAATADGKLVEFAWTGEAAAKAQKGSYLVAKTDLKAGTMLKPELVEAAEFPAAASDAGVVAEGERDFALQRPLRIDVPRGAPIFWDDFVTDREAPEPAPMPKRS